MNMETILSVLKWVALVFIAGLIGFFGKHLGHIIVSKFRKDHGPQNQFSTDGVKADRKLEKKKNKARIKELKKKRD